MVLSKEIRPNMCDGHQKHVCIHRAAGLAVRDIDLMRYIPASTSVHLTDLLDD